MEYDDHLRTLEHGCDTKCAGCKELFRASELHDGYCDSCAPRCTQCSDHRPYFEIIIDVVMCVDCAIQIREETEPPVTDYLSENN